MATIDVKRLAAEVSAFSAPGEALPNLFVVYATPQGKTTLAELEQALRAEIARLKTETIGKEEMVRVRKNLRADTIRTLETNMGLAEELAQTAQISHDPYYLERRLIQLEAVTAEDLQKFAQKYLTEDNLTVGLLKPTPAVADTRPAARGQEGAKTTSPRMQQAPKTTAPKTAIVKAGTAAGKKK